MIRLADPNLPDRPARVYNRVVALMVHTKRYAFKGLTRLAADAGVSRSAVSRLVRGERRPHYLLVTRIVGALERELGCRLDPREVVTEDRRYPTTYPCELVGCRGCLPDWAYTPEGELRPEFLDVPPRRWTLPGGVDDLEP